MNGVGRHALLHAVLGSLVKPLNFPESHIGQKLPPNSSSHPERALNGLSILHLSQRLGHQPPEKLSPPIRS